MFRSNLVLATLCSVAIVGALGQSFAHTGASGIVLERMESMKTLADNAKSVGDMLKRKTPFDLNAVKAASSAFIAHGEHMPMMFPDTKESRTGSRTEALPSIWSNWDEFTSIAKQFTQDSRALAALTEELSTGTLSVDEQIRAVRATFFTASKSCSGCHERFRLEQN